MYQRGTRYRRREFGVGQPTYSERQTESNSIDGEKRSSVTKDI